MNGEPWRYRCPEGHAAVTHRNARRPPFPREKYYCQTCFESYAELVDAKTGETVTP